MPVLYECQFCRKSGYGTPDVGTRWFPPIGWTVYMRDFVCPAQPCLARRRFSKVAAPSASQVLRASTPTSEELAIALPSRRIPRRIGPKNGASR